MDAKAFANLVGDAYKASPAGNLTKPNVPSVNSGGLVAESGASFITSLARKAGSFLNNFVPKKITPTSIIPGSDTLATVTANASQAAKQSAAGVKRVAESVSTGVKFGVGGAVFLVLAVLGLWMFSTVKNAGR